MNKSIRIARTSARAEQGAPTFLCLYHLYMNKMNYKHMIPRSECLEYGFFRNARNINYFTRFCLICY